MELPFLKCAALSITVMAVAGSASAQGSTIIGADPLSELGMLGSGSYAAGIVALTGEPFAEAFEVQTLAQPTNPWDIQLRALTDSAVADDELLWVRFYARSVGGPAEMQLVFEPTSAPFTSSFDWSEPVTTEWEEFSFMIDPIAAYSAGGAKFVFRLGFAPQTVQVADFDVRSLGVPSVTESYGAADLSKSGGTTTISVVSPGGAPASSVLNVTTSNDPNGPFAGQLFPATDFFPATNVLTDDMFFLTFWARSISASPTTGLTKITPRYRRVSDGELAAERGLMLTDRWRQYKVPMAAEIDISAGDLEKRLLVGYGPQELQIADVRWHFFGAGKDVSDFPVDLYADYPGRAEDAAWRTTAQAMIEQNRMADLEIRVINQLGDPVNGATVEVEMTRHAYYFGIALPFQSLYPGANASTRTTMQQKTLELFNMVANNNALKMPAWQGDWGGFNTPDTLSVLNWLKSNGITTRGHVMIWPRLRSLSNDAEDFFNNNQDAALRQYLLDHIDSIGTGTLGLVDEWDTLNELNTSTDLMDRFGNSIMLDWFDAATTATGTIPKFVNDYNILTTGGKTDFWQQEGLADYIEYFQANGAPIDGIGMQSHFRGDRLTPPEILWDILDRFGAYGLDIRITELTMDFLDAELEADYMRDFMTAVFAHPATGGIVHWTLHEGSGGDPRDALFNNDWSIRPKGQVHVDLVLGDWWTMETGSTVADGRFLLPSGAFLGDYTVTITKGGDTVTETFSLSEDSVGAGAVEILLNQPGVPVELDSFVVY